MPDLEIVIPAQKQFHGGIQFIRMYLRPRDHRMFGLHQIKFFFKDLLCDDVFVMKMLIDKTDIKFVLTEQIVQFIGVMRLNIQIQMRM